MTNYSAIYRNCLDALRIMVLIMVLVSLPTVDVVQEITMTLIHPLWYTCKEIFSKSN